jgi:hypothetical protein
VLPRQKDRPLQRKTLPCEYCGGKHYKPETYRKNIKAQHVETNAAESGESRGSSSGSSAGTKVPVAKKRQNSPVNNDSVAKPPQRAKSNNIGGDDTDESGNESNDEVEDCGERPLSGTLADADEGKMEEEVDPEAVGSYEL